MRALPYNDTQAMDTFSDDLLREIRVESEKHVEAVKANKAKEVKAAEAGGDAVSPVAPIEGPFRSYHGGCAMPIVRATFLVQYPCHWHLCRKILESTLVP